MGVQPIRKTVAPEIPDKLYFRIGDVARLCEVPAYVLRFWETEFPQLKPNKGGTGQRLYRKRDVEMALRIKSLLYDQGYTIPGARQVFKNEARLREAAAVEAFPPAPAPLEGAPPSIAPLQDLAPSPADDAGAEIRRNRKLLALRQELQTLLNTLSTPQSVPAENATPVKPMRPRLVLESRPEPRPVAPRQESLRLVRDLDPQGDLFPGV